MSLFAYILVFTQDSIVLGFKNLWHCLQTGNYIPESKINKIIPQDLWKLLK